MKWHGNLPEQLARNPNIDTPTQARILEQHREQDLARGIAFGAEGAATIDELVRSGAAPARAVLVEPMLPGMPRAATLAGASALGLAASTYDARDTGERVSALLAQDNPLAAQSQLIHYAGRGTGGWIGGTAAGLALGSSLSLGPVAFVVGGAVAGSYVGDQAAQWWDNRQVSHQTDRDGVNWEYNGRQWLREQTADLLDDGVNDPATQSFSALPDKAQELSHLASNKATELALGKLPSPRDPYTLAAVDTDAYSLERADWRRNPATGEWNRGIVSGYEQRGVPMIQPDVAPPLRAAELDRASEQVIRDNIANGPAPLAARYELAYRSNGWERFEPSMPAAVQTALSHNTLSASDGHQYRRDESGRWQREGSADEVVAQGNLQRELDATRAALLPQLAQHERQAATIAPWQPPTRDQLDRDNLRSTYAATGVSPSPERLEAAREAVQRTREVQNIDAGTTSLQLQRSVHGGYDADSPLAHLRRDDAGVVRVAAVTSADEIALAMLDLRGHSAPAPAAPTKLPAPTPARIDNAPTDQTPQPAPAAPDAEATPPKSTAPNDDTHDDSLGLGHRGQDVELLQYRLHRIGYLSADGASLPQTGHYDAATEQAVRQFQRDQTIAETGTADMATQQAISAAQYARIESAKTTGQDASVPPPERVQATAEEPDRAKPDRLAYPVASAPPPVSTLHTPGIANAESAQIPWPPSLQAHTEPALDLSALTPNDQTMFAKIRTGVSADIPDETVAHALLQAKRDGIADAHAIDKAAVVDGKLWIAGITPGYHAGVSASEPAPSMHDTLREIQAFNRQQEPQRSLAQDTTQRQQEDTSRVATR